MPPLIEHTNSHTLNHNTCSQLVVHHSFFVSKPVHVRVDYKAAALGVSYSYKGKQKKT